jgi:hypothetical protein
LLVQATAKKRAPPLSSPLRIGNMTDGKEKKKNNGKDIALEELKILSSIIGRIENAMYQKQSWLFALITGLTLALLKENPLICKQQFAAISIAITIVFYIADIVQRVPLYRAVLRSEKIEETLRDNKHFDSPLISKSLGEGKPLKDLLKTASSFRGSITYIAIMSVIVIIYIIAP